MCFYVFFRLKFEAMYFTPVTELKVVKVLDGILSKLNFYVLHFNITWCWNIEHCVVLHNKSCSSIIF